MFKSFDQALTNFSLWLVHPRIHPNLLSRSRIVLIPLAAWLYYMAGPLWGIGFLTILALTDFVDGRVARARGLESVEGKQLDALGDYVLAWAVVAILWRENVFSPDYSSPVFWCLVIIFTREVSMIFMSMLFKEKSDRIPSLMFGKVKAALLITALLLLLGSTVWAELLLLGEWLLYAATSFGLLSWGQYLYHFKKV